MKASLRILAAGLMMLVPFATAHAQGPSLSPISNVSLNAGGALTVNVVAVDAENRPIAITAALPPFATLNAPTLGTGVVVTSVTLMPSAAQIGDYSAAVTATAGGVSTVRVFQVTVNAAGSDQPPVVVAPPIESVTAGTALSFTVTASDPDANAISSLVASGLPPGASFTTDGAHMSGTVEWTPGDGDVGEYDIQFTATNMLSSTSVTHVRVTSAPTLSITPIPTVTVADGGSVSVPVHASGVPGAMITLTASLPTFATLNPPGSGTGLVNTSVTVSPPTGSAGTYHASITAISMAASVTEPFDIIVTGSTGGGNRPPVLSAPATETVAIGTMLSFDVSATDPDGDHVDLFGSALPPGSSFTDHANDTGSFTWTPVAGQAGTYTASFSGTDGRGGSGSASTIITVTGGTIENHAPTLSAPATEQVTVGANLSFTVTATDQDGDHVTLSASALPQGATFSDHGDNTATFAWMPGSTQPGNYQVAFLGYDGKGGSGTANTAIAVSAASGGGGGGGGGQVAGRACLIGKIQTHRDSTCFLIRPIDHSFYFKNVVLSGITLRYHGRSIAALNDARIQLRCDDDHGHGHGDGDGDGGRQGIAAVPAHAGRDPGDWDHHGDGSGNDDCNVSCSDCGDEDHDGRGDDDWGHGGYEDHAQHQKPDETCDTLGIHTCFSTDALLRLFSASTVVTATNAAPSSSPLPCALVDAQILATLSNGDTLVATFQGDHHDDDHGKGDDDDHGGSDHEGVLAAKLKPNPLHPNTELSFATTRDGQVRVTVYDMQGRVVKMLLDQYRAAGQQTLAWDGTNEWNLRVPSGVYFLRIQAPEGAVTRRVAVLK